MLIGVFMCGILAPAIVATEYNYQLEKFQAICPLLLLMWIVLLAMWTQWKPISKEPEKRARSLANLKRGKKLGSQDISSPLAFAEGLFCFLNYFLKKRIKQENVVYDK
jgi:hypothetical protein